jgi:ZIP family zinc transporter
VAVTGSAGADLARAGVLVAFPVAAAIIGSAVAASRPPGPKVTSGVQHFAAGVVFAAAAGEVLPDLKH